MMMFECSSISYLPLIFLLLWALHKLLAKFYYSVIYQASRHSPSSGRTKSKYAQATSTADSHGFTIHKSFIFPGRISHTRLSPKLHAFAYSYLMVGIPVRSPHSNWLLSVDAANWSQRGWLQIRAQDHLDRFENEKGIGHKLDRFLESQVSSSTNTIIQEIASSPSYL